MIAVRTVSTRKEQMKLPKSSYAFLDCVFVRSYKVKRDNCMLL